MSRVREPKKPRDVDRSGKQRYAAASEKGENAWQREWGGFISGVKMTEQGTAVKLPQCMDYERQNNSNFSYLFDTPAQKKAERLAKKKQEEEIKKKQKQERLLKKMKEAHARGEKVEVDWDDPFNERSKHTQALVEAQKRGLRLEGMNRKQKREFLHLSVSKQQQEALEHQKEMKPQDLMDERKQWYQQGPYPLDLIAEKLVIKKALKHARQNGLKYNYLTVHPSWVASRATKRRDAKLEALGVRVTFDDDGTVVEQDKWAMFQRMQQRDKEQRLMRNVDGVVPPSANDVPEGAGNKDALHIIGDDGAMVVAAPSTGGVRPKRERGKELMKANLTTNYISSSLVHGPSIGLEDITENNHLRTRITPVVKPPTVDEVTSSRAAKAVIKLKRDRDGAKKEKRAKMEGAKVQKKQAASRIKGVAALAPA